MSALEPCPWCGHPPTSRNNPFGTWEIWCANDTCPAACEVSDDTKEAAAAAWNRRAGDDEVQKLRAELAAARDVEQRSRDFLRWVTSNGFTDPENMLVCAEWENLRTALGGTP